MEFLSGVLHACRQSQFSQIYIFAFKQKFTAELLRFHTFARYITGCVKYPSFATKKRKYFQMVKIKQSVCVFQCSAQPHYYCCSNGQLEWNSDVDRGAVRLHFSPAYHNHLRPIQGYVPCSLYKHFISNLVCAIFSDASRIFNQKVPISSNTELELRCLQIEVTVHMGGTPIQLPLEVQTL